MSVVKLEKKVQQYSQDGDVSLTASSFSRLCSVVRKALCIAICKKIEKGGLTRLKLLGPFLERPSAFSFTEQIAICSPVPSVAERDVSAKLSRLLLIQWYLVLATV